MASKDIRGFKLPEGYYRLKTIPRAAKIYVKGSFLTIMEHAGYLSNMEIHDEFNVQLKKFIASVY